MIRAFEDRSPQVPASAFIADSALVIGDVVIGESSSVWYGSILRGDVHHIRVGARSNIQDRCVLHVTTDRFPTLIGDDVTVGHGALLHGCTVPDAVLVGLGAIVLDEAEIGAGCVVAAGALVPPGKRFPERAFIVGTPARVVRQVSEEELAWVRETAAHYVTLARRHAALTP